MQEDLQRVLVRILDDCLVLNLSPEFLYQELEQAHFLTFEEVVLVKREHRSTEKLLVSHFHSIHITLTIDH